jgi:imidazole glycerol-phosphate synthase subunit HisH
VTVQLAVLDYGMGNRRSVQKALEHVGARVAVTRDVQVLRRSCGVVIPGVGAFPKAMATLHELGLVEPLRGLAGDGLPVLGICLGMQLLFESSEEMTCTEGLGLLPGHVRWLAGTERLPHIGWNEVRFESPSPLTAGLPEGGCAFYHVHSLAPHPARPEDVVGTTEYGERFATFVERGNVAGVQFHPEKSSGQGLRLLANYVRLCEASGPDRIGLAAPA